MTAKEILEEHLETMGAKLDNSIKTFVLFAMDEYAKEYHTKQLKLSVVSSSLKEKGSEFEDWLKMCDVKKEVIVTYNRRGITYTSEQLYEKFNTFKYGF